MKIACLADLHITEKGTLGGKLFTLQGKNLKFLSLERCINFALDKLLKEKPEIVYVTEAFDRFNPTPNEIALFIETVIKLRDNGSLLIIEPGNHGVDKNKLTASPYVFLKGQSNILYTDTPLHFRYFDFDFFILPYPIKYTQNEFFYTLHKFKELARENKKYNKKSILLGHFSVDVNFEDEVVVRGEELKAFDLCLLGHIHNHQKINDNIYYIGSLDRLTFNEENDKKGFLVIDYKYDRFDVNFIESPSLFLKTFYVEDILAMSENEMLNLKEKLKEKGQFAIYRIVGNIKEEKERQKVKDFIEELKDFNVIVNVKFNVEREIKPLVSSFKEISEEEMILNYVQNHSLYKTLDQNDILTYHKQIKNKLERKVFFT